MTAVGHSRRRPPRSSVYALPLLSRKLTSIIAQLRGQHRLLFCSSVARRSCCLGRRTCCTSPGTAPRSRPDSSTRSISAWWRHASLRQKTIRCCTPSSRMLPSVIGGPDGCGATIYQLRRLCCYLLYHFIKLRSDISADHIAIQGGWLDLQRSPSKNIHAINRFCCKQSNAY